MSFRPGDILLRRKGVVMHKGLALSPNEVLHNTPERGEHVASLAEFLDGHPLRVVPQDAATRARALSSARQSLGESRSYDLLNNNCEHTVSRHSHGVSYSPQLTAWATGIGVGAATLALTRHPGWAGAAGVAAAKWVGSDFVDSERGADSDHYHSTRHIGRDRSELRRSMRPVQRLLRKFAGR